ncbi:hypothetical protein C3V39_06060 [Prevotella sp. oral taxon 820]|nr:hypothetical protein C3V39_06060 [Prevotella sp. oral taxon 820]
MKTKATDIQHILSDFLVYTNDASFRKKAKEEAGKNSSLRLDDSVFNNITANKYPFIYSVQHLLSIFLILRWQP